MCVYLLLCNCICTQVVLLLSRPHAGSASIKSTALIRYEDLTRMRILGVGAFGRVYLVRHEPSGKAYALKEMLKKRLILCKQTNNVLSEKRVLERAR